MVRPAVVSGLRALSSRGLIAVVVLAAIACSNSSSGPPASGARTESPSQASGPTPDSKAADLRVRLNLLLGEHVMVIAKDSLAATANRSDEYKGYATLLTLNGSNLTSLMASVGMPGLAK